MSKPGYQAIPASVPSKGPNHGSSAVQAEAPPPYTTNPSGPSDHPPFPHGHAPSAVGQWAGNTSQAEHQPRADGQGWTAPASLDIARSRAQRRFWVAMLWAWGIWILVGTMIGGGVSDVRQNPVGRHGHWSKHGNWHSDDNVYPVEEWKIKSD